MQSFGSSVGGSRKDSGESREGARRGDEVANRRADEVANRRADEVAIVVSNRKDSLTNAVR